MAPPRKPLIERIWEKLYVEDGHWLYDGYHDKEGYARASSSPWEGKQYRGVHTWVWESVNGPVPDGFEPDHLCRVKGCCNPDHLELVTHQVNAQRRSAQITLCPQGHPYDEDNTYTHGGRRYCRACRAAMTRRRNPLRDRRKYK